MSLHLNSLFGAGRENKYSSLFLPLSFVAQKFIFSFCRFLNIRIFVIRLKKFNFE